MFKRCSINVISMVSIFFLIPSSQCSLPAVYPGKCIFNENKIPFSSSEEIGSFLQACIDGDTDKVIEYYNDGYDVDFYWPGATPLAICLARATPGLNRFNENRTQEESDRALKTVEVLVKQGVRLDLQNDLIRINKPLLYYSRNLHPLSRAISMSNRYQRLYEIVRLLLEHNALVNGQLPRGHRTALMLAAEMRNARIVELLIEHGADIDETVDEDGDTALIATVFNQFSELEDINTTCIRTTCILAAAGSDVSKTIKYYCEKVRPFIGECQIEGEKVEAFFPETGRVIRSDDPEIREDIIDIMGGCQIEGEKVDIFCPATGRPIRSNFPHIRKQISLAQYTQSLFRAVELGDTKTLAIITHIQPTIPWDLRNRQGETLWHIALRTHNKDMLDALWYCARAGAAKSNFEGKTFVECALSASQGATDLLLFCFTLAQKTAQYELESRKSAVPDKVSPQPIMS